MPRRLKVIRDPTTGALDKFMPDTSDETDVLLIEMDDYGALRKTLSDLERRNALSESM